MKQNTLALSLLALLCGCGPLMFPAVQRLEPEEQAQVDRMWNNMLTPPQRLVRGVLLETIATFYLFQIGEDRLTMRSEKDYAGGTAVMTVTFDRAKPAVDALVIDLLDRRGRPVRSETYTGQEVLDRIRELQMVDVRIRSETDGEAPKADLTPEERAARDAIKQRARRIIAATQPAN